MLLELSPRGERQRLVDERLSRGRVNVRRSRVRAQDRRGERFLVKTVNRSCADSSHSVYRISSFTEISTLRLFLVPSLCSARPCPPIPRSPISLSQPYLLLALTESTPLLLTQSRRSLLSRSIPPHRNLPLSRSTSTPKSIFRISLQSYWSLRCSRGSKESKVRSNREDWVARMGCFRGLRK